MSPQVDWESLFPHAAPYENQRDAVERAIAVVEDGGYLAMEGACGTGKTAVALTAAATLVRDDASHVSRCVAVTPVKQQLAQFVAEARQCNAARPDDRPPLDGLELVGKADLHPYLREECLPPDEALSDLRERTADLVAHGSDVTLREPRGRVAVPASDDQWYARERARRLERLAAGLDGARLRTAGAESPYPIAPPQVADVVPEDEPLPPALEGPFDPHYAAFLAGGATSPVSFADGTDRVLDAEQLVREAVPAGVCPHECMAWLAARAAILVGNYNHVFHPAVRGLTREKIGMLGEDTFLVVDEAHVLAESARENFTTEVSRQALTTAVHDVETVEDAVEGAGGRAAQSTLSGGGDPSSREQVMRQVVAASEVSPGDLATARELLAWVRDYLDEQAVAHLDAEHPGWRADCDVRGTEERLPEYPATTVPLRPPDDPGEDDLTRAAADAGYGADAWERLADVAGVLVDVYDAPLVEREAAVGGVAAALGRWRAVDPGQYLHEVRLEPTANLQASDRWRRVYTASLSLYNCIPTAELARTFGEQGGGVVMSATLEPLDVFAEVSGLSTFAAETGRPVETATYGLHFPAENRASWVLPLPRFTSANRGDPVAAYDAMTPTRRAYAHALRLVAGSPGNVLVCLPSYREAEWFAGVLGRDEDFEKALYLDESSTRAATDDLLAEFFAGGPSVLVTSARGTVTEGVDYGGDRLHAAVVAGVPLVDTRGPRMQAVIRAYEERFGEANGYEYVATVPAVRKARQAVGRVIRSETDRGVRLLADERYAPDTARSVFGHLSAAERREFDPVSTDLLEHAFERFWDGERPD